MTEHKEGVETRGRRQAAAGARAATVFFFWVLLILAQLGLFYAVHEESSKLAKSLPRKARFSHTAIESYHAPTEEQEAQPVGGINGDPDKVYGDDKRIIHTGPNPLHNK